MLKVLPKYGDERTVQRFLWLPRTLRPRNPAFGRNDALVYRWLEVAEWRQYYVDTLGGWIDGYWTDLEVLD